MKKLFLLSLLVINGWCVTIGIPDITVPATLKAPKFINIDKNDETNSDTEQLIKSHMSNFSDQVRGQIILSKYFKVIDVKNNLAQYLDQAIDDSDDNSVDINDNSPESTTLPSKESSNTSFDQPVLNGKQNQPEFVLIGTLAAITAGEEINQISDTDKYSKVYSIDVAVDYKLVKVKNHHIVAAFTSMGHAGDVKLTADSTQKMVHNIPKLVKDAGNNLAKEVLDQLTIQLNKQPNHGVASAPVVTDVKVYK